VVNTSVKPHHGDEDGGEEEDAEFEGVADFLVGQGGAVSGGAWDTKTRARPLPFEVALYCVEQVRHLPGLRKRYLSQSAEAGL
jgi:hypothetical protein